MTQTSGQAPPARPATVGGEPNFSGIVATDLEPRLLEAIDAPNLEIWRHDIL